MSRRLKTNIPGTDWRVSIETFAADVEASLDGVDDPARPAVDPGLPWVLELGFGRGEFLSDLATQDPSRMHLGVEISAKRVLKMARRLALLPISNIRLLHASAEQVFREALGARPLQSVWINFSDPWPKTRHHRRRLVQRDLVAQIASHLVPGGELQIATDDLEYARHIDTILQGAATLENRFAPDPWRAEIPGRLHTAYERLWRAEGRPLHFWCYAKAGNPGRTRGPGS